MGRTHGMVKDDRGGLGNDLSWFIMHSALDKMMGRNYAFTCLLCFVLSQDIFESLRNLFRIFCLLFQEL